MNSTIEKLKSTNCVLFFFCVFMLAKAPKRHNGDRRGSCKIDVGATRSLLAPPEIFAP